MFNEGRYSGLKGSMRWTLNAMKAEELPSACVGCEACKKLCPQGIDITGIMGQFAKLIAEEEAIV